MAKFKPKSVDELARRPVTELATAKVQSFKKEKALRVADMGFERQDLEQVPRAVRELTVADLEDFAKKMSGIEQVNPNVNRLTVEDIQGIEYLFAEEKELALTRLATQVRGGDLQALDIDVSCCCTTPCCCCAAADADPFA